MTIVLVVNNGGYGYVGSPGKLTLSNGTFAAWYSCILFIVVSPLATMGVLSEINK